MCEHALTFELRPERAFREALDYPSEHPTNRTQIKRGMPIVPTRQSPTYATGTYLFRFERHWRVVVSGEYQEASVYTSSPTVCRSTTVPRAGQDVESQGQRLTNAVLEVLRQRPRLWPNEVLDPHVDRQNEIVETSSRSQ